VAAVAGRIRFVRFQVIVNPTTSKPIASENTVVEQATLATAAGLLPLAVA
jgi:hypothetical protein